MLESDSFSFLILILLAYLIVKLGFDAKVFDGIPKILFYICAPAIILISFTDMESGMLQHDVLLIAGFTVIYTVLIFLLAHGVLWRYKTPLRQEILVFYMMAGNVTFVGLPFASLFFGAWGVRLAILHSVVADFFIWSMATGCLCQRVD